MRVLLAAKPSPAFSRPIARPSRSLARAPRAHLLRRPVSAMTSKPSKTVVTFDVDGTLIHAVGEGANKLHKDAFVFAMNHVFGIETNIDVVKHHGFTDPLVLKAVLEFHGVAGEEVMAKLPELEAAMLAHADKAKGEGGAAHGLGVLPGVPEAVAALRARDDCVVGLVTGNLEPIAWLKMEALGLEFSEPRFGGFGSDFCSGNTAEVWRDRAMFVRKAGERAAETFGIDVTAAVHVGDTPYDIIAGEEAGARVLGVCTGVFTRAELEGSAKYLGKSTVVLDDLNDLSAVLSACGLEA